MNKGGKIHFAGVTSTLEVILSMKIYTYVKDDVWVYGGNKGGGGFLVYIQGCVHAYASGCG